MARPRLLRLINPDNGLVFEATQRQREMFYSDCALAGEPTIDEAEDLGDKSKTELAALAKSLGVSSQGNKSAIVAAIQTAQKAE